MKGLTVELHSKTQPHFDVKMKIPLSDFPGIAIEARFECDLTWDNECDCWNVPRNIRRMVCSMWLPYHTTNLFHSFVPTSGIIQEVDHQFTNWMDARSLSDIMDNCALRPDLHELAQLLEHAISASSGEAPAPRVHEHHPELQQVTL